LAKKDPTAGQCFAFEISLWKREICNRQANGMQKTQNRRKMWLGRDSFVAADYINATITSGKGHNKWIMLENALFNFHKGDWRETSLGSVYIDCLPRTMRLLALGCSCRFGCDRYGSIQIRMLTYRG